MRIRIALVVLFAMASFSSAACTAKCPPGRRLSGGKCLASLESGNAPDRDGSTSERADSGAPDGGSERDASDAVASGKAGAGGAAGRAESDVDAGKEAAGGGEAKPPARPGNAGSGGEERSPDACVAADELCDGQDNDCDGKTDEALTRACGPTPRGACMQGTEMCTSGAWSGMCKGAVESGTEVCDAEGVDENCDGTSNEGCACSAGATQPCGTDTGLCVAGTQTCDASGQWAQECMGAVSPQAELCDGQEDEDCDNKVDEGCDCTNGAMRPCGQMRGECRPGMSACVDGKWSTTCAGERGPAADGCDGRDNDCDGSTDENVQNACGGCERLANAPGSACSAGRGGCRVDGGYECNGRDATRCNAVARPSSPEVCNGADEDCDGVPDNGLQNICGGPCTADIDGTIGVACELPAAGDCYSVGKRACNAARTELRCAPCKYNCQLVDGSTISTVTPCDFANSGAVCAPEDPTCQSETVP